MPDIVRADGLRMILAEGAITMQPADNIFAHYEFGPCTWSYDPAAKMLKAIVTFADIVIIADQAELNCSTVDEFSGPLSGDGTTWTALWTTTTIFGPEYPNQVADNGTLTFIKAR
jgi:hypothetical protein